MNGMKGTSPLPVVSEMGMCQTKSLSSFIRLLSASGTCLDPEDTISVLSPWYHSSFFPLYILQVFCYLENYLMMNSEMSSYLKLLSLCVAFVEVLNDSLRTLFSPTQKPTE